MGVGSQCPGQAEVEAGRKTNSCSAGLSLDSTLDDSLTGYLRLYVHRLRLLDTKGF